MRERHHSFPQPRGPEPSNFCVKLTHTHIHTHTGSLERAGGPPGRLGGPGRTLGRFPQQAPSANPQLPVLSCHSYHPLSQPRGRPRAVGGSEGLRRALGEERWHWGDATGLSGGAGGGSTTPAPPVSVWRPPQPPGGARAPRRHAAFPASLQTNLHQGYWVFLRHLCDVVVSPGISNSHKSRQVAQQKGHSSLL